MAIFSIQASTPRCPDQLPRDADTLTEVIEDLFLHETEDAYLNWNGVRIALNYKYDLSTIFPEVVMMLGALLEQDFGTRAIEWPSSTFRGTWNLSWSEGHLTIVADWISVTGGIEAAARAASRLEIAVDAFLAEWAELVRLLSNQLDRLALSPELEGLPEFEKVARAAAKMRRGLLYRQSLPPDAQSA